MLSEKKKCSAKKTNLSASLSISGVVCSAVLRGFLQMLSLSMCVWDDRRQAAGRARGFSELSSLMRKLELWRVCVCVSSLTGVLVSAEQCVSDRRSLFDRTHPASHSGHRPGRGHMERNTGTIITNASFLVYMFWKCLWRVLHWQTPLRSSFIYLWMYI